MPIRTTNLIERSFVEERRRTKTIPRFFTEKSCLKLVHATLIGAAENWHRLGFFTDGTGCSSNFCTMPR